MIQSLINRMNQQQYHHHQQQPPLLVDDVSFSNFSSASGEASASNSSANRDQEATAAAHPPPHQQQPPPKKKRNLPGNPDPDAEVIALSPKSLLATNRFVCEICNKGFQRDQNLQLHRRGHNLPWKLKQRSNKEVVRKKVYVCPETNCVHHDPSRALGDLTGIKKHYCRKHGEKKWKCDKCSKRYAVHSDWKAHSKICGTREYRCDCGTLFSRKDSFITHRAFCDVLAEETVRAITTNPLLPAATQQQQEAGHGHDHQSPAAASTLFGLQNPHQLSGSGDQLHPHFPVPAPVKQEQPQHDNQQQQQGQSFGLAPPWVQPSSSSSPTPTSLMFSQGLIQNPNGHATTSTTDLDHHQNPAGNVLGGSTNYNFPTAGGSSSSYNNPPPQLSHTHMSATALLQKAAQMGAIISSKLAALPVTAHPPSPPHMDMDMDMAASSTSGPPTTPTFGLNLSSSDRQLETSSTLGFFFNQGGSTVSTVGVGVAGLSSFGNKAANGTNIASSAAGGGCDGGGPGNTTLGSGSGGGTSTSSSSSSLLHDIMMSSLPSFDGSADNPFGNDNLTRDFLGLRPLPHGDIILNMAALGDHANPAASAYASASSQDHNKTWQC